jgi:hypothetical protein
MARTHPLTAVSTVAPTLALARHCLLFGPAARSHGAALTLRPRALTRARTYTRRLLYRIQVFGAFFAANFNALSCGYPSNGGRIPSFGGKSRWSIPSFGGRAVLLTIFRLG